MSDPTQAATDVVRLSINLHPTVAEELKYLAERNGVSVTEAVRRAIGAWNFIVEVQDNPRECLVVVTDNGWGSTTTSAVILSSLADES